MDDGANWFPTMVENGDVMNNNNVTNVYNIIPTPNVPCRPYPVLCCRRDDYRASPAPILEGEIVKSFRNLTLPETIATSADYVDYVETKGYIQISAGSPT